VDTVLRHLLDEGRKAGLLVTEVDLPQVRTLFEVFAGNLRALKHYVPRPIAGRVTVLRASESLPESAQAPGRGWGAFCGGLEVQEVPGNHYTTLHAPNVQVLAERLSALLYRSATGGSPSAD
jgi:thioesterase domain-containing protein